MATYRYRLIRTMFDKVVGVAVQPPGGGLLMRLGQQDLDFDPKTAPKLESLDFYLDNMAAKPELKKLEIDNAGPVRTIDLPCFNTLHLFLEKVKHLPED